MNPGCTICRIVCSRVYAVGIATGCLIETDKIFLIGGELAAVKLNSYPLVLLFTAFLNQILGGRLFLV